MSANLLDLVGHTPMITLPTGVGSPHVRLLGKHEGQNPGGSVKDRPARSMILGAEARGELGAGVRIIEPTSGNTGIALAMIAAARSYPIELVMPETATAERVQLMRAFGAEVILTPSSGGMEGAIDHARNKAAKGGYLLLDQFQNDDNWRAHEVGTGPEIWEQTHGAVTHFVSAMGTTGTIMGVSRALKAKNPAVQIIGCRPTEGACIPGIRRWPEAYLPRIFEAERIDRTIDVSQEDAESSARALAHSVGVLVGVSAGGAVWAARQVCAELDARGQPGTVVCVLCDRGDRYLSSNLFG